MKFTVGDGVETRSVSAIRPLAREVWYAVCATFDPEAGTLRLSQRAVLNAYNSRLSRTTPLDANCVQTESCSLAPGDAGVPVIIAGCAEGAGERTRVTALFNGKIDSPLITRGALDGEALSRLETVGLEPKDLNARWDFAAGITRSGVDADAVLDASGNGMHGTCCNQPDRAMTGWNWDGSEERFVHAPEMYGAIWFHEDFAGRLPMAKDAVVQRAGGPAFGHLRLAARGGEQPGPHPVLCDARPGKQTRTDRVSRPDVLLHGLRQQPGHAKRRQHAADARGVCYARRHRPGDA